MPEFLIEASFRLTSAIAGSRELAANRAGVAARALHILPR